MWCFTEQQCVAVYGENFCPSQLQVNRREKFREKRLLKNVAKVCDQSNNFLCTMRHVTCAIVKRKIILQYVLHSKSKSIKSTAEAVSKNVSCRSFAKFNKIF